MSRQNVYNPLIIFLQSANCNAIKKGCTKLFHQASSKQDFFTLKRKNTKKSVNSSKVQIHRRGNSLDMRGSQEYVRCQYEDVNISQQVCLNSCIDDDVKTTSTKSYDTHEDLQACRSANNKKKKYFQFAQTSKLGSSVGVKGQSFGVLKIEKQTQSHTFKSQFFEPNQMRVPQRYQKNNKSDTLLRFKQNIMKKASLSIKIKSFMLFPQPLGRGTYSVVYKAIHKKTGMLCAIKAIYKSQIIRQNLIDNLIEQIKIMSNHEHENIAKLWGFFQQGPKFYMILEYCSDGQLYGLIKKFQTCKNYKQTYLKKLSFIKQICMAIQYLHQNKIMHRDIKPENILLTMWGTAKLSDFGWAKIILSPAEQLRKTLCGTPLYLAPQQIKQSQYSKSVDLWAMGILTYQLLTGKIPFLIQSIEDLHKIVNEQVSFDEIKCYPHAAQFVSLLLEKDGLKRLQVEKLSQHQLFSSLEELNQTNFFYQLQFGRLI